jgi:hypothetical protein
MNTTKLSKKISESRIKQKEDRQCLNAQLMKTLGLPNGTAFPGLPQGGYMRNLISES